MRKRTGSWQVLLATWIVIGALSFFAAPEPSAAATLVLNSTQDTLDAVPGDGVCADDNALCTLRAAVMEANALPGRDAIEFPPGTYTLTIPGENEDLAGSGDLDVTDDLVLSGGSADSTVVDGNQIDRVLHVIGPVSMEVSNLKIFNGRTPNQLEEGTGDVGLGGGILNRGGHLRLLQVVLVGNFALTAGGGMRNELGTLDIVDTTVIGNVGGISSHAGGAGGGISNEGSASIADSLITGNRGNSGGGLASAGTMSILRTTVSENSASAFVGGGIANSGDLTVINSVLSSNRAGDRGGALRNLTGTVSIRDSVLTDNAAVREDGGAIANDIGSISVQAVTVHRNSAGRNGGGIANAASDASPVSPANLTLLNVSLSANTAVGVGGGVVNGTGNNAGNISVMSSTIFSNSARSGGGVSNAPGQIATLVNSIVATSAAGQGCGGVVTSQGHNLSSDTTCAFAGPGDLQNIDPKLGPLADNGGPTQTHALLAGSPAIDAADAGSCPSADQRGIARPVDGNSDGAAVCDIGAYEAEAGTTGPLSSSTPSSSPAPAVSPPTAPAQLPATGGPVALRKE